ncbi:MAG: DUF3237 family protein [Gammaproteobacteria bacterium]
MPTAPPRSMSPPTDYGDACFVTAPRMRTGAPRYRRVNNLVCGARGRLRSGRVECQVFRVTND